MASVHLLYLCPVFLGFGYFFNGILAGSSSSSKTPDCNPDGHAPPFNYAVRDVIGCYINAFANHLLLVTDNNTVAHLWAGSDLVDYLYEESWEDFHYRSCYSLTSCFLKWPAKESRSDAVERARNDVQYYSGKPLVYYKLTCNCQHWVSWWAYGYAYSYQSLRYASWDCQAGKKHS